MTTRKVKQRSLVGYNMEFEARKMRCLFGLWLITLTVVSICGAQNDIDYRKENQSEDLNVDEANLSDDTVEQDVEKKEKIGDLNEISIHRQKKSLKFHRPRFLGGNEEKIDGNSRAGEENNLGSQQKARSVEETGFANSLSENVSFDERDSDSEPNSGSQNERLNFVVPKSFETESSHSRVQKSLRNILNSLQKREVNLELPEIESGAAAIHANNLPLDAFSHEIYENQINGGPGSKEPRVEESFFDAKIKDLTNQMLNDPKSKLVCDKSDLELLHDIIDRYRVGQNEKNNKKLRNLDTASLQELILDETDESGSGGNHQSDSRKTKTKSKMKETSQKETRKDEGTSSSLDLNLENRRTDTHKFKTKTRLREFGEKDTSEEEVTNSPSNSDLERVIQEAAEKIGLWVNQNFDTAKRMKKTKLKADPVRKEHKHASTTASCVESDTEEVSFNSIKLNDLRVESDRDILGHKAHIPNAEIKKAAAIKMFLHPETARVSENDVVDASVKATSGKLNISSNINSEHSESEFEDVPSKYRKNKGALKLSIGEVRKAKLTTLPPCGQTRKPDHGKCECTKIISIQDIDPKLLEMLCSKSTTTKSSQSPCVLSSTRPMNTTLSTTTQPTRRTHTPAMTSTTNRPKKLGSSGFIDRDAVLSDKILKQLVNESFKDAFTDSLVGDRNNTKAAFDKINLNNLSDFIHLLVNAADSDVRNTTSKNDDVGLSKKRPVAPSACGLATLDRPSSRNNLRFDHANKNSKLLNHFVNLAAMESERTKKLTRPTTPAERLPAEHTTPSPLKALSGFMDLIRRQSSETVSSQKSLLEDKGVSEHLRIKPSENQTVALNVFIKAAIIPDFKNASQKHEVKGSYLASVNGVDKVASRVQSKVDTAGLKDAVSGKSLLPDNRLNDLLKSIIVKARFERQSGPRVLKSFAVGLRHREESE